MADAKAELRARIFLRSALPLIKVVLSERPGYGRFLWRARGVVQFAAQDSPQGAHVEIGGGALQVVQGLADRPDLRLSFKRLDDLNAFFAGALKAPSIAGLRGLPLLVRLLPFLLKLKLLMPDAMPRKPDEKALKVKLLLYMVTHALSQLNKGGDPAFSKVVKTSPDRVFQWTVLGGGPAAYLRMKAGKTKAGRGTYTRRQPFVHMMFPDIDSAFDVLTQKVSTVDAVKQGKLKLEGSLEYSKEIGLHMQRVEAITTEG
jgi:hypothetical protein